jgi:hypothetical protein
MSFITRHAVQFGDPRFIEWTDKGKVKEIKDEQGRLVRYDTSGLKPLIEPETNSIVYTDLDRAVIRINKGDILAEDFLPLEELEHLLTIGTLVRNHDNRRTANWIISGGQRIYREDPPGTVRRPAEDFNPSANRKPAGFVEER